MLYDTTYAMVLYVTNAEIIKLPLDGDITFELGSCPHTKGAPRDHVGVVRPIVTHPTAQTGAQSWQPPEVSGD